MSATLLNSLTRLEGNIGSAADRESSKPDLRFKSNKCFYKTKSLVSHQEDN